MSCEVISRAGEAHILGSHLGQGRTLRPVLDWSIFKQPQNSGQHHSLIYTEQKYVSLKGVTTPSQTSRKPE